MLGTKLHNPSQNYSVLLGSYRHQWSRISRKSPPEPRSVVTNGPMVIILVLLCPPIPIRWVNTEVGAQIAIGIDQTPFLVKTCPRCAFLGCPQPTLVLQTRGCPNDVHKLLKGFIAIFSKSSHCRKWLGLSGLITFPQVQAWAF